MRTLSEVAGGQLVETGGHGPELLEPAEAALDDVAGLVLLGVECRRSSAGRSTTPSARDLVGPKFAFRKGCTYGSFEEDINYRMTSAR
jgi:hypothetical protein